ncbi:MAG: ABC transporter permease subunit [Chloroflexi bacterium]|nr:ABC transporter permease subunit [Chloroflexota bacterium]
MIGHVFNLVRWEWFKLQRRWMPWILLALMVLFSQLFIWGTFFSYRNQVQSGGEFFLGAGGPGERGVRVSCNDLLAGRIPDLPPGIDPGVLEQLRLSCTRMTVERQDQLREMYSGFTLPGSIPNALGVAQGMGLFLIAILAASTLGTEFGWGTLRAVLVRGTGRWQYLTAKLVLISLLAGAALVVVAIVTLVSSAAAGALASEPPAGAPGALGWTDAMINFGKAWFGLLPYLALAACVTILTASSAAGMAVALAYYFAEQIVVAIFINVFAWFQTMADYLLGRNISAWMTGNQQRTLRGGLLTGEGAFPGDLHAFLVLSAYIIVLGAIAFRRFQQRDISGASGT